MDGLTSFILWNVIRNAMLVVTAPCITPCHTLFPRGKYLGAYPQPHSKVKVKVKI
jgi:hypothetical protein